MGDAKKDQPAKRKAMGFGDIFQYHNQIDFKFGSISNAAAKKQILLDDSSSSEDEDFELLSAQRQQWKKNDDIVELGDDASSDNDENEDSLTLNDSQDMIPSPPPPPPMPDTPTIACETYRLRQRDKIREVESTLYFLKQASQESQSPSSPPLSFISPTSGNVILVEEDSSPYVPQKPSDRAMVVKVRTRSGVQRFNMKAGEPFSKIVPELSKKENISEEKILLILRGEGIDMSDTPLALKVTVADILECLVSQNDTTTEDMMNDEDGIEVKIQRGNSKEIKIFRVNMKDPLEKLMVKYCSSMGFPREKVHFSFDGDEISSTDTPEDLDMDDGNIIDVNVK